jgi:hypothetical protein
MPDHPGWEPPMGLDAFVCCTCYREGRATPPPFPADLLEFDETGEPELAVPWDDEHEELHNRFWDWLETCCPHKDMHYESVRVSNWGGYRSFQQALGRAGWERFPTLRAELPESNGGIMSAEAAARALQDLAVFNGLPQVGDAWYLVDGDTGDVVHEYIAGYEGRFLLGGASGVDLGVDPGGFFLVSRSDPPRELFRAMRFEQRPLDPAGVDAYGRGRVELVDRDSGRRLTSPIAVTREVAWPDGRALDQEGRSCQHAPRQLRVEGRPVTPDRYRYAVEPLERVCRAAVATGNPVAWT